MRPLIGSNSGAAHGPSYHLPGACISRWTVPLFASRWGEQRASTRQVRRLASSAEVATDGALLDERRRRRPARKPPGVRQAVAMVNDPPARAPRAFPR